MHLRSFALTAVATVLIGSFAPSANAGPLLEWLFRGRQTTQPTVPIGAPIPLGNGYGSMPANVAGYPGYAAAYPGYSAAYPAYPSSPYGSYSAGYAPSANYIPNLGYAANLGNYYGNGLPVIGPNGAGYTAQRPSGIAAATLPQPMSYVPNYASNALKAPVTYYRPLLTTDPNTGSQVVAMAPCTSYQYLTQRVPTFGQSALYGSYQAPQLQPLQAMPTYTLPSGGIPLAQSAPSSGAVMGYSPYSAYQATQPAVVSPSYSTNYAPSTIYSPATSYPATSDPATSYPATNYPTTVYSGQPSYSSGTIVSPSYGSMGSGVPLGSSSYGSISTGSADTHWQSVPGLIAPPANSVLPGINSPPTDSIYPPASGSLSDPANTPPSLPSDGNSVFRPQLKSIIPEATRSGRESALNSSSIGDRSLLSDPPRVEMPVNNPIPAPEGMEKPSWSPGLLRKEDMTALRPVTRSTQFAGQSKKIHWASFQQELTLSDSSGNTASENSVHSSSQNRPMLLDQAEPALRNQVRSSQNESLQLTQPNSTRTQASAGDMVPISGQKRASFNPSSLPAPAQVPSSGPTSSAGPTSSDSYSTSGWSSIRK